MKPEEFIRSSLERKFEHVEGGLVDYLLEQFPPELQERLNLEIQDYDDAKAEAYLTTKLVNRRYALQVHNSEILKEAGIEVIKEIPHAILQHVENSLEAGEEGELGRGKNGEVIRSASAPGTCYKVLFLDRAQEMAATAAREAYLQFQAFRILAQHPDVAQVPAVLRYIDHKDLRAIHMETIDGVSLDSILNGNYEFPENFDVDVFCEKLANAILLLNESGLFHRDLLHNAGNVIVDKYGKPCIIDFGSAIRSAGSSSDPDGAELDGNSYKVTLGGRRIMGNDQSCIEDFKRKILNRLKEQYGG